MGYYAKRDDEVAIYLSKTVQLDLYLESGCSIYEDAENGNDILIATPDDGYLVDKPTIEVTQTINISEKNRSDIEYLAMMTGIDLDIS